MDPITLGLTILGTGSSLLGSIMGIGDSKKAAKINQQIYQEQLQAEAVKKQAMELSASRQQTENVRNMQRARSLALSAATNQGAQFGSGLPGGYGQISGQGNWNALGISQNLGLGEQMFDINGRISGLKSQLSSVQSDMATDQGISAIGGSISRIATPFGNMAQGFGGRNSSLGGGGTQSYGQFVNSIGSNGIY